LEAASGRNIAIGVGVVASAVLVVALALVLKRAPAEPDASGQAPPGEVSTIESAPAPPRASVAGPRPVPPDYVPPYAVDPAIAALADRRSPNRIPDDITSRIPGIENPEDVPVVVDLLLDTAEDDAVRNEAANLLRRSGWPGLTEALTRVLDDPRETPRFRAFAVQHLWQTLDSGGDAATSGTMVRLREALSDGPVEVRREALLALARLRDPSAAEAVGLWLAAREAHGLRDAAIRCAYDLGLREHIPLIRERLRDGDEAVRIAAIAALSRWGDVESRGAFEEAARSGSVRLRRCAEAALKRLD
jgi:hypothetical protein